MRYWTIFFLFFPIFLIGKQWSRENLYKYSILDRDSEAEVLDGTDYQWKNNGIFFLRNGWLRTDNINIGKDFVLNGVFINAEGRFVFRVRDMQTEEVLFETIFDSEGAKQLNSPITGNVYLQLVSLKEHSILYAFGVKRIPLDVIQDKDLKLDRSVIFEGEDPLRIMFATHYSSYVDVLIFDQSGRIVDILAKDQLYSEGQHELLWNPQDKSLLNSKSGHYVAYFKAKTESGFKQEASHFFYFIRK